MNILRISTRIYPDVGGPAKQVRILSEFLSNNNFSSFNITCLPKNKFNIKKEKINNNFTIYYLPLHAPGINSGIFSVGWPSETGACCPLPQVPGI